MSTVPARALLEPLREDYFRAIAYSAFFAIVITRVEDGTFVYITDRFCALMGQSNRQLGERSAT
jgi:hypothetical protein